MNMGLYDYNKSNAYPKSNVSPNLDITLNRNSNSIPNPLFLILSVDSNKMISLAM